MIAYGKVFLFFFFPRLAYTVHGPLCFYLSPPCLSVIRQADFQAPSTLHLPDTMLLLYFCLYICLSALSGAFLNMVA